MKLRTMVAALVLAGLMTFLYSAQSDPHESVASDGSPAPPLETTPTRIDHAPSCFPWAFKRRAPSIVLYTRL